MRLEHIKNLTEARYAGKTLYFIQAFDPEDGLLETFAGPFDNKNEANKFVKWMERHDQKKFGDRVNPNDMIVYGVHEMLSAEDFIKEMEEHASLSFVFSP